MKRWLCIALAMIFVLCGLSIAVAEGETGQKNNDTPSQGNDSLKLDPEYWAFDDEDGLWWGLSRYFDATCGNYNLQCDLSMSGVDKDINPPSFRFYVTDAKTEKKVGDSKLKAVIITAGGKTYVHLGRKKGPNGFSLIQTMEGNQKVVSGYSLPIEGDNRKLLEALAKTDSATIVALYETNDYWFEKELTGKEYEEQIGSWARNIVNSDAWKQLGKEDVSNRVLPELTILDKSLSVEEIKQQYGSAKSGSAIKLNKFDSDESGEVANLPQNNDSIKNNPSYKEYDETWQIIDRMIGNFKPTAVMTMLTFVGKGEDSPVTPPVLSFKAGKADDPTRVMFDNVPIETLRIVIDDMEYYYDNPDGFVHSEEIGYGIAFVGDNRQVLHALANGKIATFTIKFKGIQKAVVIEVDGKHGMRLQDVFGRWAKSIVNSAIWFKLPSDEFMQYYAMDVHVQVTNLAEKRTSKSAAASSTAKPRATKSNFDHTKVDVVTTKGKAWNIGIFGKYTEEGDTWQYTGKMAYANGNPTLMLIYSGKLDNSIIDAPCLRFVENAKTHSLGHIVSCTIKIGNKQYAFNHLETDSEGNSMISFTGDNRKLLDAWEKMIDPAVGPVSAVGNKKSITTITLQFEKGKSVNYSFDDGNLRKMFGTFAYVINNTIDWTLVE